MLMPYSEASYRQFAEMACCQTASSRRPTVRQELVALIMGGIFVLETASVILQVASFKLTGRRIFRMAPIHHHFELKGWAEPKVIVRFWIISLLLVLAGLATLKLR